MKSLFAAVALLLLPGSSKANELTLEAGSVVTIRPGQATKVTCAAPSAAAVLPVCRLKNSHIEGIYYVMAGETQIGSLVDLGQGAAKIKDLRKNGLCL